MSPESPQSMRYASVDGLALPLGNNECLFQPSQGGQAHVMTVQVLQALDACRAFRELGEHGVEVQRAVPQLFGQRSAVQQVLEHLIARGLLMSERTWLQDLGSGDSGAPLRRITIRACDRSPQFARLLESLVDFAPEALAGRELVVVDDSRNPDQARANANALEQVRGRLPGSQRYLGRAERERVVSRLVKQFPGRAESLRWLLGPRGESAGTWFGGGQAFNFCLLLAAGDRVAMLDEDYLLPLRRPPGASPGLDLDPSPYFPARFFDRFEGCADHGEAITGDPFAPHLALCGRSLGGLLEQHWPGGLAGISPSQMPHLRAGGFVVATVTGFYGSAATASNLWLFLLDEASRADLCRDRDAYLRHVHAPHIWHGPNRHRLMKQGNFTPFLLDTSRFAAFATPYGRGEDAFFASLNRFCLPRSLVVQTHFAVGHRQERERRRQGAQGDLEPTNYNHFLRDFLALRADDAQAAEPLQRLRYAGVLMQDLATASAARRIEILREYAAQARAERIRLLQEALGQAPDAPVFWQADVRDLIQRQARALADTTPPEVEPWPTSPDFDTLARRFAESSAQMAEACATWAELWPAVQEQGDRLFS